MLEEKGLLNREQLLEVIQLGEDQDVEFKAAQGGLPKSLWETVSAFANTESGIIILGVVERDDEFVIEGIQRPKTLIKSFWDAHNNSQKLSSPVCRDSDINILTIAGKKVICIRVPRVSRQCSPIFINGNPLTGSFKRNYEGDYHCTPSEVRAMLRDAGDKPLDGQILEKFTIDDLDSDSITAYHNRFASRTPAHPFLAQNGLDFLESLGSGDTIDTVISQASHWRDY